MSATIAYEREPARSGRALVEGATTGLRLAAAPVFAMMSLLARVGDDGAQAMLCSTSHTPLLDGMVPMYALMAVVHLTPWIDLLSRRGRKAGDVLDAS